MINECANSETHTCSLFAHCIDATHGYACACLDGYIDTSSQHGLLPGRKCSNGMFYILKNFNKLN